MIKHYVGEIGTVIELDTGIDISAASKTKIKVLKPDGTEVCWDADTSETFPTKVVYTLDEGDFDQKGVYRMQAYVEIGDGKFLGETFEETVYAKFE